METQLTGWTFVRTVTAAGGTHVCLRKVEPRAVFELIVKERITMLCAAPTVLISLANAPEELRRAAPRGIQVLTAGRRRRLRQSSDWKTNLAGRSPTSMA